MINENQKMILREYIKIGKIKGGELLLTKNIFLSFLNDMMKANIIIRGCNVWQYAGSNYDPDKIVEMPGDGIWIEEDRSSSLEKAEYNKLILIKYIKSRFSEEVAFFSPLFDDEMVSTYILGSNKGGNKYNQC
jgi:hypothetical protein